MRAGAAAGRARRRTAVAPSPLVGATGAGWWRCQPPSACRYGGPGNRTGPMVGSSHSVQKPRWCRWSASSTSAGEFTPANGQPAAWAAAVPSARVWSNNHG
jgi:hypothetical protein